MDKSWKEIKTYLQICIDSQRETRAAIIRRAGLSKDSYFKIFRDDRLDKPMRKATVNRLARALNLVVVEYINGLPQIYSRTELEREKHYANIFSAQDLIEHALAAMEFSDLSALTGISVSSLKSIYENVSGDITVDDETLKNIDSVIKGEIHLDEDGNFVRWVAKDETIHDQGLRLLLTEENRNKHGITDMEEHELVLIDAGRKSCSTLESWISVLYSLRALGAGKNN